MLLHKNSLASKLLDAIDIGELKTRGEWAKHFKVSVARIDQAMGSLRKRRFMVNPIGTNNNPYTGEYEQGKLKITTNSKHDIREINSRDKKLITKRLLNQFKLVSESIKNFPDEYDQLETSLNQIQMLILEGKEELKLEKYGNLGNSTNEN